MIELQAIAAFFSLVFTCVSIALAVMVFISFLHNLNVPPTDLAETLTLSEYLQQHPDCHTSHGIKCCHCNSRSIKNWGHRTIDDEWRVFICNHCNARLYRSDNIDRDHKPLNWVPFLKGIWNLVRLLFKPVKMLIILLGRAAFALLLAIAKFMTSLNKP